MQFRGGQSNPTYLLTDGTHRWVLRRKPPGVLLPSAHAVDREYRVITALHGAGFLVPRTRLMCEVLCYAKLKSQLHDLVNRLLVLFSRHLEALREGLRYKYRDAIPRPHARRGRTLRE